MKIKTKATKKISKKNILRKPKTKVTVNKSIVSSGLGFPKKLQMTHKYNGSISLAGIAGAFVSWNFSCNGMYDPDQTGVGHQPMYFDQLTALYDHYCVIGSKAVFNIIPTNSSYGSAAMGVFINDDTTVTPTSFPTAIEQSNGTHRFVAFNNTKPISFTANWSAKRNFGAAVLANTELQGTASANPTEQQYFTVWSQSIDGVTTAQFWVEVVITYVAIWKELKELGPS